MNDVMGGDSIFFDGFVFVDVLWCEYLDDFE